MTVTGDSNIQALETVHSLHRGPIDLYGFAAFLFHAESED